MSVRARKPQRVQSHIDPTPTMQGKDENYAALSSLRAEQKKYGTCLSLIKKATCIGGENAMLDSLSVRKEDVIAFVMGSQRRSLVDS